MPDPKWPARLRDEHAEANKGEAPDIRARYFKGRVVVTVTELPLIAYAIERNDDGTFDVLVDDPEGTPLTRGSAHPWETRR